jgi:hypothetical protein
MIAPGCQSQQTGRCQVLNVSEVQSYLDDHEQRAIRLRQNCAPFGSEAIFARHDGLEVKLRYEQVHQLGQFFLLLFCNCCKLKCGPFLLLAKFCKTGQDARCSF